MSHDCIHNHDGRGQAAALASAWSALCCVPATHPWLWLARSEATAAAWSICMVLLDPLSAVLLAKGAEVLGHG